MYTLLLLDDGNVREKIAFVLDSQFHATVFEAATPEQAKALLIEHGHAIKLLVMGCEKLKLRDFDRLRAEFSHLQAIVFLYDESDRGLTIPPPPGHPQPVFVDRKDIILNLVHAVSALIKQMLVPDEANLHTADDRDFCRIRTRLLLSVCPLQNDIFIRLGSAKYLKLMREGDTFDLADMEKYTIRKGVEYLYLRNQESQEFIRKLQAELTRYLEAKPELQMDEVAQLNDLVYEAIQSLGTAVGFTPEIQQMAKTQVQTTLKAMGKSPRLSRLFDKIESYQGKYIASHGTVTGYLACAIASQMKWGSDTTFHKLTLASFLHDITLTNHDLAACRTLDETQNDRFSDAERKAYKNHTVAGAEVARQFSEVPPDVDIIIAQHHEHADGTGFPRGLSATYIAPLSAIFIVAHDMARFALDQGTTFSAADFVEIAREKYKPSQFRKVVQAIEMLV